MAAWNQEHPTRQVQFGSRIRSEPRAPDSPGAVRLPHPEPLGLGPEPATRSRQGGGSVGPSAKSGLKAFLGFW